MAYPAGDDLSALSLELDGSWRRGEETKPFHVRSRFAYGLVKELPAKTAMGRDVEVSVKRMLGQMFSGVDVHPVNRLNHTALALEEGRHVFP